MITQTPHSSASDQSALALLREQRSHLLFVLTNAVPGQEADFTKWYKGSYRQAASTMQHVLNIEQYEQHEVDITRGRYPRFPFRYLAICELSLDGAEEAGSLIEQHSALHRGGLVAQPPATWLYYPTSERAGRRPAKQPSMLTLAFANGLPGQESEFREWYATRHIRHALNIPALVSGQCFERTQFQSHGSADAAYATIAVYEQEAPPQSILDSFASLPEGTLRFPMLDRSRFAECVFQPL
jgi:hypothetical protein